LELQAAPLQGMEGRCLQRPRSAEGAQGLSPSFPTREGRDPRKRSRTTSWSKGLPHRSDCS